MFSLQRLDDAFNLIRRPNRIHPSAAQFVTHITLLTMHIPIKMIYYVAVCSGDDLNGFQDDLLCFCVSWG